ncbi:Aste57867_5623 [Aphanomyces stellatus]|uniref:Aste57867_5623 protein n=1 Tax=Aphanomyces stellatus TaxID=120398 RepID=A0A485KD47_9STRA|nr:hypothetical protein As57867_005610 [Aphanomyces stellatus]VFT82669.1 Aste57867_5623 [Aphanomyces stellatus]
MRETPTESQSSRTRGCHARPEQMRRATTVSQKRQKHWTFVTSSTHSYVQSFLLNLPLPVDTVDGSHKPRFVVNPPNQPCGSDNPLVEPLESDEFDGDQSSDDASTKRPAKTFPSVGCRAMWFLWYYGDDVWPPLRTLRQKDLCTTGHQYVHLQLMDQSGLEAIFNDVFAAFVAGCDPPCALTGESRATFASKWVVDKAPSFAKMAFSSMDCRKLWHLWFKGDATTDGEPYHRYPNWDLCGGGPSIRLQVATYHPSDDRFLVTKCGSSGSKATTRPRARHIDTASQEMDVT